jgi:hypothetical protein
MFYNKWRRHKNRKNLKKAHIELKNATTNLFLFGEGGRVMVVIVLKSHNIIIK